MPTNTTKSYKKKEQERQVPATFDGNAAPHDEAIERSVLGALMLQKDAYSTVSDLLRPQSFWEDKHQYIYEAIQKLAMAERGVDILTVANQLQQMGKLEMVGGPAYLASLTVEMTSSAHLLFHAQILAQKALARELIALSNEVMRKSYYEEEDIEDIRQYAEGQLFELGERSMKRDVEQIDTIIESTLKNMKAAKDTASGYTGYATGFTALDKVTSGWQRSDLIIIAARPAMGKTAFVLSMAKNMAVQYEYPVAVFSLEMSKEQLVKRLIMNECEIQGDKIRNGSLTQKDWNQLYSRIDALMGAPLFIDDTPSLSVLELRSKARKLKREHEIKCIIIDYLQLMNASGMNFGSREQEVSIISRNLKGLAKELDIPIIALSQLNRMVEGRTGLDGKRPQLSDLRESGAIEQDADMVCFIHRPDYYVRGNQAVEGYKPEMKGKAEIIIAKHRNGATKTIVLRFDDQHARFMNDDGSVIDPNDGAMLEEHDPYNPQAPVSEVDMYHSVPSSIDPSAMSTDFTEF